MCIMSTYTYVCIIAVHYVIRSFEGDQRGKTVSAMLNNA